MVTLLIIADAARNYHNHGDTPHACGNYGDASRGFGDIVHGLRLPILYGEIVHDISASDVGDAALYYIVTVLMSSVTLIVILVSVYILPLMIMVQTYENAHDCGS
jgi:hypothetical protein